MQLLNYLQTCCLLLKISTTKIPQLPSNDGSSYTGLTRQYVCHYLACHWSQKMTTCHPTNAQNILNNFLNYITASKTRMMTTMIQAYERIPVLSWTLWTEYARFSKNWISPIQYFPALMDRWFSTSTVLTVRHTRLPVSVGLHVGLSPLPLQWLCLWMGNSAWHCCPIQTDWLLIWLC